MRGFFVVAYAQEGHARCFCAQAVQLLPVADHEQLLRLYAEVFSALEERFWRGLQAPGLLNRGQVIEKLGRDLEGFQPLLG